MLMLRTLGIVALRRDAHACGGGVIEMHRKVVFSATLTSDDEHKRADSFILFLGQLWLAYAGVGI
jgi:hypothetical protein